MFLEMGRWKFGTGLTQRPFPKRTASAVSLSRALLEAPCHFFGRVVINYSMNINNFMYFILLLHEFFIQ